MLATQIITKKTFLFISILGCSFLLAPVPQASADTLSSLGPIIVRTEPIEVDPDGLPILVRTEPIEVDPDGLRTGTR